MIARLTTMLLAAALIGAAATGCGSPENQGVAVFPSAGTPTASPKTQISFRGVKPKDLKDVSVRGTESGKHRGRLEAHSDGDGASFLPDQPFRAGEVVKVRAGVKLLGERKGAVRFRIATPAPMVVPAQ